MTTVPWLRPALVASWREIVVVILLVIGPFAANSAWSVWHGSGDDYVGRIMSNRYLLAGGAFESGMLMLFLVFLHKRQWMPADFRIIPDVWSSLQALPLLVCMMIANCVVVLTGFALLFTLQTKYHELAPFLVDNNPHLTPHSVHVSWIVLLGADASSTPSLRKLTCIAYIFNQLAVKTGSRPRRCLATVLLRRCRATALVRAWSTCSASGWYLHNFGSLVLADAQSVDPDLVPCAARHWVAKHR